MVVCIYISIYIYIITSSIRPYPRSQVDPYSTKYHQANLYTQTLNV